MTRVRTEVTEIGPKSEKSFGVGILAIGEMMACFHRRGTKDEEMDWLKTCVSGLQNAAASSLRNQVGTCCWPESIYFNYWPFRYVLLVTGDSSKVQSETCITRVSRYFCIMTIKYIRLDSRNGMCLTCTTGNNSNNWPEFFRVSCTLDFVKSPTFLLCNVVANELS